ncbi:MAG: hypothetical protein NTU45_13675 [Planctomycetota bacterium]|nr:hypothetical protein [Planctomycetota bacterium]
MDAQHQQRERIADLVDAGALARLPGLLCHLLAKLRESTESPRREIKQSDDRAERVIGERLVAEAGKTVNRIRDRLWFGQEDLGTLAPISAQTRKRDHFRCAESLRHGVSTRSDGRVRIRKLRVRPGSGEALVLGNIRAGCKA